APGRGFFAPLEDSASGRGVRTLCGGSSTASGRGATHGSTAPATVTSSVAGTLGAARGAATEDPSPAAVAGSGVAAAGPGRDRTALRAAQARGLVRAPVARSRTVATATTDTAAAVDVERRRSVVVPDPAVAP